MRDPILSFEKSSGPFSPRLQRAAKIALLMFAALCLYIFFHFGFDRLFTVQSLKENQVWIRERFSESPVSTVAIYALFAIAYTVFCLPAASVPMIIAGALFGVARGTPICAVSLSIGAVISLLNTRFVLRDFVRRHFAKKAATVEREYHRRGAEVLIAMRMIPLMPYSLTNLAFGLTPIPVFRFWLITVLASAPAVFLYGSAGTELSKIDSASDVLTPRLVASLCGLFALSFVARRVIPRVKALIYK